jgi:hypothetical protein
MYRIIVEVEKSGKENFYVQRNYFLYFWTYLIERKGISTNTCRIQYDTIVDANICIQNEVNNDYLKSQRKIKKRYIAK